MKDLTPEQIEAAIILKSLWEQAKRAQPFTQVEAAKHTGIPQSNLSGLLNLRGSPEGPRIGLGPVSVRKLAIFLGQKLGQEIKPSTIMPSLAYLDDRPGRYAPDDDSPSPRFAPLLERDQAVEWLSGDLSYDGLPIGTPQIPIFDQWSGRRCFAVLATQQDAAANRDIAVGDVLMCDPARRPGAGELGFYGIDGDWVLGTLQRHAGKWVLTFGAFDPIELEDEDSARISIVLANYRLSDPEIKKLMHK